jgi:probable HAF family extracellular repeat protein
MSPTITLRTIPALFFLSLCFSLFPSPAHASYEVQGLGFLGAWFGSLHDSSGYGLNNNGQAVGRSYVTNAAAPGREAFLWDPVTGIRGTGDLPGGSFLSTAEAVNDAGQVAGWGTTAAGVQAFFWSEASGLLGLEGFAGTSSAYGINSSGQVVGGGASANGQEAFLWSASSGLRFLGDLPGGTYGSVAYDINDAGLVVGSSGSTAGPQAFVWEQSGGIRGLDTAPGFSGCLASAINNENPAKIAGYCYSPTAAESFVWDAATGRILESLGHLPEGYSRNYARGINDVGQVVGYALDAGGTPWPFVYAPGSAAGMVNLQNTIATPGWSLRDAHGINNPGTIVGTGRDPNGEFQAVLLHPAVCTPSLELCDDGIDNDCDMLADCGDSDCSLNMVCSACYSNSDCSWPFSGRYCEKPYGDCLGPGRCEFPPSPSGSCAQVVTCGCDGTFYATPCAAARAGVNGTAYGVCCPDNDGDGSSPSGGLCGSSPDCDDDDAAVHPGAAEVCDGNDNDCDGLVDEIPPLIAASQHEFSFQGIPGGPSPAAQTLTITNPGCGPFVWSASADAPWLTLSRTSGGDGDSTMLGVVTAGLAAGVHSAAITIAAPDDGSLASSTVTVNVTVTADTTPPTGSLLIKNGAVSTTTRAVALSLSASDTGGSGLDAMRLVNGGGATGAWEPCQTAKAWTLTSGAGTKTVWVQFRDRAGNVSDADPLKAGVQSYKDEIVFDPNPPTGSLLINNGAAATATRAVTLHLSATDAGGSGVDAMRFVNSGGAAGAWEPYQTAKAWTLTSGAGSKTVWVQFKDKAGNISDADPVKAGAQSNKDTIEYTGP